MYFAVCSNPSTPLSKEQHDGPGAIYGGVLFSFDFVACIQVIHIDVIISISRML